MGGSGSGRRPDSTRRKTSAVGMLDVRQLKRQGFFRPGQSMHWTARSNDGTLFSISAPAAQDKLFLAHRWQPEPDCWEAQSYEVELEWMPCHLGGQRPWLRCPISACGRRVACLYLAPSGGYSCRYCQRLVYETQYERSDWRLMTKGNKIRCRLGWGPGILNPAGGRPKYMHWDTYERLRHREGRVMDALARLILL